MHANKLFHTKKKLYLSSFLFLFLRVASHSVSLAANYIYYTRNKVNILNRLKFILFGVRVRFYFVIFIPFSWSQTRYIAIVPFFFFLLFCYNLWQTKSYFMFQFHFYFPFIVHSPEKSRMNKEDCVLCALFNMFAYIFY